MVLTDENVVEILNIQNGNKYSSVLVSLFCVGIIIFILFTQCKVSNIRLQMKDASLILIFIALLAYINGYEKLFILLLLVFVLIYFTPQRIIEKYLSPFLNTKNTKKDTKPILKEKLPKQEFTEETNEKTYTTDNEITIDADIDVDIPVDEEFDGIIEGEENVVEMIKKKSE